MGVQTFTSSVTNHCFRLRPGQDLKKELLFYAQTHRIHAGVILSAVGSLNKAHIRLSGGKDTVEFNGPFEIVSLTGTLSTESLHMHLSFSDFEGRVRGGHLMEGCPVFTTVEILIQENQDLIFNRKFDEETGYNELVIQNRI